MERETGVKRKGVSKMKRNDTGTGRADERGKKTVAPTTRLMKFVFEFLLLEIGSFLLLPQVIGEIVADVKEAAISSWSGANGG